MPSNTVLLFREERFFKTPDGVIWSKWGTGPRVWASYTEVFPRITVIARIADVQRPQSGWTPSSIPNLTWSTIPYFDSLRSFLSNRRHILTALSTVASNRSPLILRVPSPLANLAYRTLASRPFALEVAGDPYDQLSPRSMTHPLRPLIRRSYTLLQQRLCRRARVLRYVTQSALQTRYPPGPQSAVFAASDADLDDALFRSTPRVFSLDPLRLVTVGMMEQLYKGQDTLLRTVALLTRSGHTVRLTLVGDGRHRQSLERMAAQLGIANAVDFTGVLDRPALITRLDNSDLFVLPSRQEGTPRAMLEAMARRLPCIGSNVGGIPELLETDVLVSPDDPGRLFEKIAEVIRRPDTLNYWSERNFQVALEHSAEKRRAHDIAFLTCVAETCADNS